MAKRMRTLVIWLAAGWLATAAQAGSAGRASAQTVPGFLVEDYCSVPDPIRISFAPNGDLYCGRDPNYSGTGTAWKVHRIQPGCTVTECGDAGIPDPDALIYDAAGTVSGVAGSIIVGGIFSGSTGRVSAIRPDGTIVTLWQSTAITNPSDFEFDGTGRLLFVENQTRRVFQSTGGAPAVLITTATGTGLPFITVDPSDRIFTNVHGTNAIQIHAFDGTLIDDSFATMASDVALDFGPGGAFGTDLYALGLPAGALFRIDASGVVTQIGSGFAQAGDIAFGPDGNLYVSLHPSDKIVRIRPNPATGVPSHSGEGLRLAAAFPNPFVSDVTIECAAVRGASNGAFAAQPRAEIFDASGRLVRRLAPDGTGRAAGDAPGSIRFRWDGRDDGGRETGAGAYFYRVDLDGNAAGRGKLVRISR